MKFLILVSWLIVARVDADAHSVTATADADADDVYIDGVRHQTEILYNDSWISSIAVDNNYNILYYIDDFRTGTLNLNTKQHKYIGIKSSATSLHVDQVSQDLYVGTTGGIVKYQACTGEAVPVGAGGASVRHMYYKRVLYYTDYWSGGMSTLHNQHSEKLNNLPHEIYKFVIDDDDVVFFGNISGVYTQRLSSDHSTLCYNGTHIHNLVMDTNGKVYFTSGDGIYEIIKHDATYRKVATIKELGYIAFDYNNNLIFSTVNKIYILRPIAEGCNTRNCSVCHERVIDDTNINNTVNIDKHVDGELDIMYSKIDKLETDLVKILEGINTKLDTLVNDQVDRKREVKIMSKTSDKPLPVQVDEQVHSVRLSSPHLTNTDNK